MASLVTDDKLNDPNQQQADPNAQAPSAGSGGPTTLSSSASSSDVGGPSASTAGIGAGGQGGWTNIQSYLNANKDNQGSADALNQKVGSQFDKEQSNIDTSANAVKQSAQGQADSVKAAQGNASDWINKAAQGYNYDGNQAQDYTDTTSKLKNAYSGQYAGPNSWNYGLSADTQKTGAALGDQNQFSQYMGDLYNEKAGGQLTAGGRALQTQLDVNNSSLNDARNNLSSRYSNLGSYLNQDLTDTNKAIGDARSAYTTNQNSLKDYLNNSLNTENSSIAQQEGAAKDQFGQEAKGKVGLDGVYSGSAPVLGDKTYQDYLSQVDQSPDAPYWANFNGTGKGFGSANHALDPTYQHDANGIDTTSGFNQIYSTNNWVNDENAKYANTADTDKRKYNTIQDILGGTDKKQQGFKVRGK